MVARLVTVLLCALIQICYPESEPELNITTDCTYAENLVKVTVFGEYLAVLAVNKEDEFEFEESLDETVSWTLYIKLKTPVEFDPVFDKALGMDVYQILIQARIKVEMVQSEGDHEVLIECSYMTYADDVSGGSELTEQIQSPVIITNNTGSVAESNFTISIVKINEQPFTSKIRMGRIVKLLATMTGTVNETKFHVTNCNAFSTDLNSSSVVLIDGCGTGFPFSLKEGFTLRGLSAISPSFKMFRIKRSQGITFKCSFVICNDECPENSCQAKDDNRRRKREADGELKFSLEDKQSDSKNLQNIHSNTGQHRKSQNFNEISENQSRLHIGKLDIDKLLPVLLEGRLGAKVEDVQLIRGGLIINVPSRNGKETDVGKLKDDTSNSYVGTSDVFQVEGDEDFEIPLGEMSKINRVIESVSTQIVTVSESSENSVPPIVADDVITGIPTESKIKSNTDNNMNKDNLVPKNRMPSTETGTLHQDAKGINSRESITSSDQKEAPETKILLSANKDKSNGKPAQISANPLVHKTSALNVVDVERNSEKSKSTEMKRRLLNLNSSIQITPTAHALFISVIISLREIFA
ncbi:uncharacterized protein LOC127710386 [Mytilus californianus]|uniref:uncharacterized protein LOC127710386 n=1 Tax=Mytilus californianus TaxID=6549 RepID=UPI002245FBDF|nr:uncharacterized protein LOC127710386 [Mytilus californianus]